MTDLERETFLAMLEGGAIVSDAADICGVSVSSLYKYRKQDLEFRAEWDEAYRIGADAYVKEARRRAVEGTDEPVFHKGEVCGFVRRYSDTLLLALMNARNPEKYDPRMRAMLAEWDRADREAERGKADPSAHTAALEAIQALERIATAKALEATKPADPEPIEGEPTCPTDGA